MIAFFRFLQGYLRIKVCGFSPERFMNLCCNHSILLWNIEKCNEDDYNMNISLRGYFQIRPFVRKTGTKVAVLEKYGLPFFIPRLKVHMFFLFGIVATLLFLFWTTGYIWKIDLEGNVTISDKEIYALLQEMNVDIGCSKRNISVEELEKALRNEFTNITWTSPQIEGTCLRIQIKENDKLLIVEENTDTPTHLIASKDGKVVSIITRNGIPHVKAGMDVKKGDLLVSGQVPIVNDNGETTNYHCYPADADVYLQCEYTFQATLPISYVKHQYNGKQYKSLYLNLFGKELSFPNYTAKQNCDVHSDRKQAKAFGQWYLPLFYGSDLYQEYRPVTTKYTETEVKDYFNKEIHTFVSSLEEKGVQFIEKNVKIDKDGSKWIAEAVFTVVEKTGESVPIDRLDLEPIRTNTSETSTNNE